MTSSGTPVKYLSCDSAGEHQPKLQGAREKETVTLEYTTPYTPQPNGCIKRRFSVIKEGELAMLISAKLNDAAQKMLWAEAVHK